MTQLQAHMIRVGACGHFVVVHTAKMGACPVDECGAESGIVIVLGKGPKDRMACPKCHVHWPADKKRCPGCNAKEKRAYVSQA